MNQPTQMLILDYAMATPEINEAIAYHYVHAGCIVDYRQYYPNLVRDDVDNYSVIALLAGRTPAFPSALMSQNEVAIAAEFVRKGGTLILAPNLEGGEGANERFLYNRILADLGINIRICNDQVLDEEHKYAATLWDRPFYRPVSDHPVAAGVADQLALERSTSLLAGEDTSVMLTAFETARPRSGAPVMALGRAGEGHVLVAGRYLLNATGIALRISGEPLVHPELLDETAVFLQNVANYTVGLGTGSADWADVNPAPAERVGAVGSVDFDLDRSEVLDYLPHGVNVDTFASEDTLLPPGLPDSAIRRPRILDDYDRDLASHYAQLPGDRLYGWVRDEGIRACWGSTVDWGRTIKSKEDVEKVTGTLKDMDVNLFWGISNCQAVGGPGYSEEEESKVLQQWNWTAEALADSNVKWYPTLDYRYFREEKTRCYGAQGQKLDAVSPMDLDFWHNNWRNSMLAIAEYSLECPSIGGICMDVELYSHPPAYNYYTGYGFEDECYFTVLEHWKGWGDPGILNEAEDVQLPDRFNFLRVHGLLDEYFNVLSSEVERICRSIRSDILRINPDLLLASYVFTTPCNWFDLGLYRGFSSPERPIILMTFNVKSGRMMEQLRRRGVYAYHTSVALLGMMKENEYETVFTNAREYGHGLWMNNVNSLIIEDPSSVEAPASQGIGFDAAVKAIYDAGQKSKTSK
ncbi:MAG: hypothetical protein HOH43_24370 [Candidatus Latescibacteria bacterium]|jgi:hypothetical protein|nr:hypothetical protein [Candidatus Latescibacterota bacterium]